MSIKISELPAGSAPTGVELIPAVQSAVTVSLTAAQLTAAAAAASPASVLPLLANALYAVDSGAANAYVLTTALSTPAPVVGQLVSFIPAHPNTGASTVNFDTQGLKNIINQQGTALVGGELTVPTWLQWTGTSWQIVGTGPTPDKVRTPTEITAGVIPVNYGIAPLNILRYGNNTIPGTTDMTIAINIAINVAGQGTTSVEPPISIPAITGGTVYIPPGLYSYSAIRIRSGVTLTGSGYGTWLQQQAGSLNGIFFDNTDPNAFGAAFFCSLQNMQILGIENASVLLKNGINIRGNGSASPPYAAGSTAYLVEALFTNLVLRCADKITNFYAPDRSDPTGGWNVRFENCIFRDANCGVFGELGDPEFLACTFTQLNYGVIANTYSACYEKCTFYRIDRVGLVLLSQGNLIKGCNFESIAYPYIYISDTNLVTSGGVTYTCLLTHVSGASTQPGVGGSWATYWAVYNTSNWYDEVIGAMGVLNQAVPWVTATQYTAAGLAEKNLILSNRFVNRENRYSGGGRGGSNIPHPELLTSPYAYADGDLWTVFRDNFTDTSVDFSWRSGYIF